MATPLTIVINHKKIYGRPNLPYIRQQLEEAQAAARTLHELHPASSAIAPLCEALLHAVVEASREMSKSQTGVDSLLLRREVVSRRVPLSTERRAARNSTKPQ